MAGQRVRRRDVERKECGLHSFRLSLLSILLLTAMQAFSPLAFAEGHTYPGGQKPSAYKPVAPPPAPAPQPAPAARPAVAPQMPSPPRAIAAPAVHAQAPVAQAPQFQAPKPHSQVPPIAAPKVAQVAGSTSQRFAGDYRGQPAYPEPAHAVPPARNPAPYVEPRPRQGSTFSQPAPRSVPTYVEPRFVPRSTPGYQAQYRQPQFRPRSAYANPYSRPVQYRQNNGNGVGSEHLPAWMRQHQNESPEEQEKALRQEPGFNRLDPQQQQNLINTLHRLDAMPPEQRARTLARIENMERLSPQMKQAVRESARQMSDLPLDRKRLVQKAFRDLQAMPPEQRQAVMNTPQFAGQFSAQERSIMGNLLAIEPYQHPGATQIQPQYGKQ